MGAIGTKKGAMEFAVGYEWTKADAERAFNGLDFKRATQEDLLVAMAEFAGRELLHRQYLQAAQKGQVTKKVKELQDLRKKIEEYQHSLKKERSMFVAIIAKLYPPLKRMGLEDPWVEALLATYKEYEEAA